jgi:hypothetical protein
MVLEAAADNVDVAGQQRRRQRVAGEALVPCAVEA